MPTTTPPSLMVIQLLVTQLLGSYLCKASTNLRRQSPALTVPAKRQLGQLLR